jgi:IPT/TIG domain
MSIKYAACAVVAIASSLLVSPIPLKAQLPFAGVSLKVSRENAPPGAIAQIKVLITEPKPISTGRLRASFDRLAAFAGIAVMSPAHDTFGVAQISGSEIQFAVRSTTSSFGMDPDYPVLTVAARVPADTPLGTVMPVTLGGSGISFVAPGGAVYPTEIDEGAVVAERGISIDDVSPGSADLPAGSVVTIVGRGFRPDTRVRFSEVKLSLVRFVDSTHLRVTLAGPARMHGMRIRAENRDGAKTTYFSYQRTRRQGASAFAALQAAVPLFPLRLVTQARVDIAAVSTALALQNIGNTIAPVSLDLLAPGGQRLATKLVSVNPDRFTVTEISELFGITYVPGLSVRVRSAVPIQVMGIEVNAAGDATPIPPR